MEKIRFPRLKRFERIVRFMHESREDFPPASPGWKSAEDLTLVVYDIKMHACQAFSRTEILSLTEFLRAEDLFDALLEMIRHVNRAAIAFASASDDAPPLCLPQGGSRRDILAAARSFCDWALPLREKFLEYGLAEDFLARMAETIEKIEGAARMKRSGDDDSSVFAIVGAVRRGEALARRLDAIVRIRYARDPAKLAAWTIAGHFENEPAAELHLE